MELNTELDSTVKKIVSPDMVKYVSGEIRTNIGNNVMNQTKLKSNPLFIQKIFEIKLE